MGDIRPRWLLQKIPRALRMATRRTRGRRVRDVVRALAATVVDPYMKSGSHSAPARGAE